MAPSPTSSVRESRCGRIPRSIWVRRRRKRKASRVLKKRFYLLQFMLWFLLDKMIEVEEQRRFSRSCESLLKLRRDHVMFGSDLLCALSHNMFAAKTNAPT